MIEDQPDSGYLVSNAVNNLSSVPSTINASPWTPDEVNATTNATTATKLYNIDNSTSLPPTGNIIPVNSSTSTSDSVLLPGGGLLTGKLCPHEDSSSNSNTAANSASDTKASSSNNILEWFTQGSLVKSKPYLYNVYPSSVNV